jgi:hypothetical protein
MATSTFNMLGLPSDGPDLLGAERAVSGFGVEVAWPVFGWCELGWRYGAWMTADATDRNFTQLGEFSSGIARRLVGASCGIRFPFSLLPCGGVHGRLIIMKSAVIPWMFSFHLIATEFIADSF